MACLKKKMSIASTETIEKNMCMMHYLGEQGEFHVLHPKPYS